MHLDTPCEWYFLRRWHPHSESYLPLIRTVHGRFVFLKNDIPDDPLLCRQESDLCRSDLPWTYTIPLFQWPEYSPLLQHRSVSRKILCMEYWQSADCYRSQDWFPAFGLCCVRRRWPLLCFSGRNPRYSELPYRKSRRSGRLFSLRYGSVWQSFSRISWNQSLLSVLTSKPHVCG